MPRMDDVPADKIPTKLLLLGDPKAGKTDYLMRAAEAGFKILYIDGDVAAPTLAKLSPEAKRNIYYMPIHDYTNQNGDYVCNMAEFFVEFTTSGRFLWNDTLCRVFKSSDYKPEEGHVIWEIFPASIGADSIVGLDSWTTLTASLINWKADDLSIDLMEIEKYGREMYTGAGHKATQFLKLLRGLRCNTVVIGHPREYVKKSAPKGSKGVVPEKDMKIDWIQMVPVSTSNPHALTMGASFSDIGWIKITPTGQRNIDFKPNPDYMIGGGFDMIGKVEEYSLASLLKSRGCAPSSADPEWIHVYGPGEYELPQKKAVIPLGSKNGAAAKLEAQSSDSASEPAPTKVSGLSALAGLKARGVQR